MNNDDILENLYELEIDFESDIEIMEHDLVRKKLNYETLRLVREKFIEINKVAYPKLGRTETGKLCWERKLTMENGEEKVKVNERDALLGKFNIGSR